MDMRGERDEAGLRAADERLSKYYTNSSSMSALARQYVEHTKMVCEVINERLAKVPHHRLRAVGLTDADEALNWARGRSLVREAMGGRGRRMYPEGIHTAFEIWEEIYLRKSTHNVPFGGTNLGKTSCADFLRLITVPLNILCFGKPTCVLNILVPRRTLVSQAKESFQSLLELYGSIQIVNLDTGEAICLDDAHKAALADISGRTNIQIDALNLSRTRKEIEKRVGQAVRQRMLLLTLIDEIHFGPSKYGRLGRHAKGLIPGIDDPSVPMPTGFDDETFAMVRDAARNTACFSATPVSELQPPWRLIPMRYSATYASAYLWFMGRRIADHQIPVWGFSEFRDRSKIDLTGVMPSRLDTPSATSGKQAPTQDAVLGAYQKIVRALRWFYRHGHDITGVDWKGSFIRLHRNNPDSIRLANYIEKHTDITVIRYFRHDNNGDGNNGNIDEDNGSIDENIRDQLKDRIEKGEKFCVIATAMCRMADDLPKEVCYFLDFTAKASYEVALRQGTAGRAGGHGKKSLVVMSDYNARMIREDNERKGWPVKAPNPYTHLDVPVRRGRPGRQVQVKALVGSTVVMPPKLRKAINVVQSHLLAMAQQQCGFLPVGYMKGKTKNDPSYLIDQHGNKVHKWNFSIKRSAILPPLDQLFGPLLRDMTNLIMAQNQFESVDLLGFDGDEMPDYRGPKRVCFAPNPYSLRDIERLNERGNTSTAHGINSAKPWVPSGMIVQFVWSTRAGFLEIAEIFWPVKRLTRKVITDVGVHPDDDIWQIGVRNDD